MYIGSIAGKGSPVSAKYTYRRRCLDSPLFPDLHPERSPQEGFIDFKAGNLGAGIETGWKWTTVLDGGVDIVIKLSRPCFIDKVIIRQGKESGLGALEVLYEDGDGSLLQAGRVSAGPDGVIRDAEVTAPAGVSAGGLIIRLAGCFKDMVIESMDIICAVLDPPAVYPVPASMAVKGETSIALQDLRHVAVLPGAGRDALFAANLLSEKIFECFGAEVPVSGGDMLKSLKNSIVFSAPPESRPPELEKEGYHINSSGEELRVTASDRRGFIYSAETVLSLLRSGPVPACEISDRPFLGIRGIHMGLPPREDIPFIKRLIKYLLAPMRFNTLFLEIAGGMRFDSHPEINKTWIECNLKAKEGKLPPFPHGAMVAGGGVLEKAEVAELADYARDFGMEVIPEVQSLSHVQYITAAHPDTGEREESSLEPGDIDLAREDTPPDKLYAHCYCALSEKAAGIVFDLIDEIVETIKPSRYVHMGLDEVYQIGICPACRAEDPSDLLAGHINRMHSHLKKKGLSMMIWADMLHDVTPYKTPPAISKIPRDIVLLDFIWYFHLDKDIENRLLEHGFSVIMGNMYSSHYPRYEARAGKKGIAGAQVSTWCRADEYTLGAYGKIFDLMYSANMMWSAGYTAEARLAYTRIISDLMPGLRSQLHHEKYPSQIEPKECFQLELPAGRDDSPIPCEIAGSLPPLATFSGGVPLEIVNPRSAGAAGIEIPVGDCFDSIVFLHSAGGNVEIIPFKPLIKIGEYTVEYEDGRTVSVPVEYGGNIAVWSRRYASPLPHAFHRHQGYFAVYQADACVQACTPDGRPVTVYGYEWVNPHGKLKIKSISLKAGQRKDSPVYLFAAAGVRTLRREK